MGCRAQAVVTALLVCAGLVVGVPAGFAQPQVRVDGGVTALGFDTGGKWFAVGYSGADGTGRVRLYSMKRKGGDHVDLPKMSKPIADVAFVGEDKYLAIADRGSEVVVWSWPEISEVFRVNLGKKQGQPGSHFRLLGNPKGPHIAWVEVGPAGGAGKAEVVELPRGEVISSFDKVSVEHQVAWSRDGGHLLLAGAIWNWDTLKSWKPAAAAVTALSDDGARAASAPPSKCDGISIVDLAGGKALDTVETEQGGCPAFLWFVAGDKSLVWLADDGTRGSILYRWNAKSNRVKAVKKGLPAATIAVLSSSGRLLAIADERRVRFVRLR